MDIENEETAVGCDRECSSEPRPFKIHGTGYWTVKKAWATWGIVSNFIGDTYGLKEINGNYVKSNCM